MQGEALEKKKGTELFAMADAVIAIALYIAAKKIDECLAAVKLAGLISP